MANTDVPGIHWIDIARPQLELGPTATDYDGPATLLPGDRIQFGATGQRVMVTAAATATDAAGMTVAFEPQLRTAVSAGTQVIWDRPTSIYVPTSPELVFPARRTSLPGYALELVEAW